MCYFCKRDSQVEVRRPLEVSSRNSDDDDDDDDEEVFGFRGFRSFRESR